MHIHGLLSCPDKVHRRDLHKPAGMLQWPVHAFPAARPWVGCLCRDLNLPPATLHSVDSVYFAELFDCISDDVLYIRTPRGTAIPCGSKFLEARRVAIQQKSDLHKVVLPSRRIWLRVADPASSRRKLSEASVAFLQYWLRWCKSPTLYRSLEFPLRAQLVSAADAMGEGLVFAIGGFIKCGGSCLWFSESVNVSNMNFTGVTLTHGASDNISCYECLAQIALLHCLSAVVPGGRLCVRGLRAFRRRGRRATFGIWGLAGRWGGGG